MKRGKIKRGLSSLTLAILFLLVVLVLNFISYNIFTRVDLTEDKLYTLSPASKRLMKSLDDIVNVKVYFSKKLPPDLLVLRNEVKDLLDEYSRYAHGNLKVEFIDPTSDPKIETQVQRMGIPPVQMNVFEKDKIEVVKGYLGIAVMYEDRFEVIPIVQTLENLEYEISSRILKVYRNEIIPVGLHVKKEDEENFSTLKRELKKQYNVVTLHNGDDIPDSLKVLIVLDLPSMDSSDLKKLDGYIEKGGNVIFLVNGVDIDMQTLRATPVARKKLEYLDKFHVKLNNDLVLDRFNEVAPFSQGYIRFLVPYPYWVKTIKRYMNSTHPILSKLDAVSFPWTSSIELLVDSTDTTSGIEVTILARTSPQAWTRRGMFDLNPQSVRMPPPKSEKKQYNLAVLLRGSFLSKDEKKSPMSTILIVGNNRMVQDLFTDLFPQDIVFVMNAVDYMGLGEDLIGIRSKGITERSLKPIGEKTKLVLKIILTYGMALLVVVFGLVRYTLRRRRMK